MIALFEVGSVVITTGALSLCEIEHVVPGNLIERHKCGDWGDICKEDCKENGLSVMYGYKIISVYKLNGRDHCKVYVITEADRSATTICLPSEY